MRYLFFDTESSNCFGNVYKMCEWGCLFTDTNFKVDSTSKKDVLFNPGSDGKFNLTGRKDGRDLILAHPYEEYRSSMLFKDYYGNIEFLLGLKDQMIFLWASENDIQALLDQCVRYHLPKISFVSYDVQILFKRVMPEIKGTPSLERAMDILELDRSSIVPHRPDEDALMTSMVLKALCEKTGMTPEQLVKEYPECEIESIATYKELHQRHIARVERKKLHEQRKKAHAEFDAKMKEAYPEGIPETQDREKTFNLSSNTRLHVDKAFAKTKTWIDRGFFMRRSPDVAYLVCLDEEEIRHLTNKMDLTSLKLVSIDEFDKLTKGE